MKKRWFIGASLAAYTLLVGIPAIFHAIWLDEAQAWNIARDLNFFQMFTLSSYEGNGMLWHVLIYPLAHFGLPVVSMQVINFLLALGTVYLILRYAPFPIMARLALISSYFFVFEYAVLARNYQISAFILILIALAYPTRFIRPWRFFILLVLLAFTNVHSAIIVVAIVLVFAYEAWRNKTVIKRNTTILCLAFMTYAGLAQLLMLIPVSNVAAQLQVTHLFVSIQSINAALSAVTRAFLPISIGGHVFWNITVFDHDGLIGIGVALCVWLCTLVPFMRQRKMLILYVGTSLGLLLFFFSKHSHYIRHDGFIFLAWLFVLWISAKELSGVDSKNIKAPWTFWAKVVITIILAAQAIGGVVGLYHAYTEPLSNSRYIADYLAKTPNNIPVLVYINIQATSLSAYQDKREFYCLKTEDDCTYMLWSTLAWSTIQDIGMSSSTLYNIGTAIRLFERRDPTRPYYILFDNTYSAHAFGFDDSRLAASIDEPCITVNCSYYLYYYDPEIKRKSLF